MNKQQAINAVMTMAGYECVSDFIDYINDKYGLSLDRQNFYLFYSRGETVTIGHALLFEAVENWIKREQVTDKS